MVAHETTDPVPEKPVDNPYVKELKERYVKCVTDACTLVVMISGITPDDTKYAKQEKIKGALKIMSKDIKGCYDTNAKYYDEQITSAAVKIAEAAYATDSSAIPEQDSDPDSLPQE